jgi:predicted phosphodiesterase
MTVKFLQLSDIHFGQEKDGTLPEHDDVRQRLIEDAQIMAGKRGPADMILVVGDTAYSGKDHEYKRAGIWLDVLAKAVGCKEKAVRIVPGNHDCDRSKVSEVCKMIHDVIRSGTPKSAHSHLEKIAKDADGPNPSPSPLLPKLEAYHGFASSYNCNFKSTGTPLWFHDFEFPEGVTLRLFGMNSVQVCDEKDDAGNMVLGNTQYVLDFEQDVIPIVLVHHPLKWLKDHEEAEQYLHNRAHVIMVGHEHIGKFSKVSTATHERIDLWSGATNPPEHGALYKHTYNWIEMSLIPNAAGALALRVEVFSRAWSPDTTRFTADRPRMDDADSVSFDIICPRLKPRKIENAAEKLPESTVSPPRVTTAAPEMNPKGGVQVQPSDDDIEQLQFLFWRHLDWRQRLTVLVQADVLPASAEKPVPQTLERLAIDTAREQGKLEAVWDAMLPLLPEEKRQPNPFKAS